MVTSMVTLAMMSSKNNAIFNRLTYVLIVPSTANGVPGSISEMADSWKVEQTCVTGPSPVMDSSAPCANHEARKEWAEKECHMVSNDCWHLGHSYTQHASFLLDRSWINPIRTRSHRVSRNWTKLSFDNSTSNVSTTRASTWRQSRLSLFLSLSFQLWYRRWLRVSVYSTGCFLWKMSIGQRTRQVAYSRPMP